MKQRRANEAESVLKRVNNQCKSNEIKQRTQSIEKKSFKTRTGSLKRSVKSIHCLETPSKIKEILFVYEISTANILCSNAILEMFLFIMGKDRNVPSLSKTRLCQALSSSCGHSILPMCTFSLN